jgi:hypothetical protein
MHAGRTRPRKTNLILALAFFVLATVAALNDASFAENWADVTEILYAMPVPQGIVMSLAVFAWFFALPFFFLRAYQCVGGDATHGARKIFEALILRVGRSESQKKS